MILNAHQKLATTVGTLEIDEQTARKIAVLIDEGNCGDGVAIELVDTGGGSWRVTLHARARSDENEVRDLIAAAVGPMLAAQLHFERVAAKDWVAASLAELKPVAAGRFVVHGAHDRTRIPFNRIGIEIEASLAFGTGHHGTTRGCLLALDGICKSLTKQRILIDRHPELRATGAPRRMSGRGARAVALRGPLRSHLRVAEQRLRILDLGTGSGVLAIAAARALRGRVLATDVDAEALRVARANARLNGVGPPIEIVHASGVTKQVRTRVPFDLVFANILLAPLQRVAASLTTRVARGGRIVLSGLLASQANAALAAYRKLSLERRIDLDGWTTLVLKRAI